MKKRSAIAKVLLVLLILAVFAGAAVFFYRFQIFQYSADAIIRNILPGYVEVDRISFDLPGSRVVLKGFRILNPPGFSAKYLLEIDELTARYTMKGKNVLDGIEILEPLFQRPIFTIERLGDGTLNLSRMPAFIRDLSDRSVTAAEKVERDAKRRETTAEARIDKRVQALIGNRTIPDLITLPQTFTLKKGRLLFIDNQGFREPYSISLDAIDAQMSLRLDAKYTNVLEAGSNGQGILNDNPGQVVRWNSVYDPTTPRLTMANRFDVSGLDILTFKPYYDRFSPFDFNRGIFSGTLILNYDNGGIGSTNEIRLGSLAFSIKQRDENSQFWDASAGDIAKYFTSPSGEVVFDFKIKGDMAHPKFMLGPISKQAVTAMAVDKVSQVLQQVASQAQGVAQTAVGVPAGAQTDAQKAADYIGIISDLISKKK